MPDQVARIGVVLIVAFLLAPASLGDTVGDAMLLLLAGYGALTLFIIVADQFWSEE
jgi:Na+/proline symporter